MAEAAATAAVATNYEVDLGSLMAYDALAAAPSSSREELREDCLRKGKELAQAVSDALFGLPANEDRDGEAC